MNGLDLAIVVGALCAGWAGWRIGLLARVLSWVGLLAGLFIGSRVAPPLFERSAGSDATRIAFLGLVLLGAALVGKWIGMAIGRGLHRRLPARPLRTADRLGGAGLGLAGVVLLTWVAVPLAGALPGWPSEQTRRSALARLVHDTLPAPPAALQSLRHLVAGARFPQVRDLFGPTDTNTDEITADPGWVSPSAASDAAVLVRSNGCSLTSEGSGVAVGAHRIVTNAHVVAGGSRVEIEDVDNTTRSARVVAFDPVLDLALLDVETLRAESVILGVPRRNTSVAIAGHPGGGKLRVATGTVRRRVRARGLDIYDRRRAARDVLVLATSLRPGDSGAGVFDPGGRLVGVAFAVAPDAPGVAYAVTAADVRTFLAKATATGDAVSTGTCLGG